MRCFGLIVALIATIFLSPQSIFACFCGSPDVAKAIWKANAIFSAKVVEVSSERVVFDIEEVWKGHVSGTVVLNQQGSSCDLNFKAGQIYLIYARKYKHMLSAEDRWSTDVCHGSKNMADAEKDLRKLWSLKLNKPQRQAQSSPRPNNGMQRARIQHAFTFQGSCAPLMPSVGRPRSVYRSQKEKPMTVQEMGNSIKPKSGSVTLEQRAHYFPQEDGTLLVQAVEQTTNARYFFESK